MNRKLLLFAMMPCVMASCTTEMEDYLNLPNEDNAEFLKVSRTCSIETDSSDLGELMCLKRAEESLHPNGLCNENRLLSIKTMSANTELIKPSSSDDDFFSSNLYAIRELPITIKARSAASGSTASNCYFSCNGAGKEVVLSNSSTAAQSKFYIKIMPPSSGVSYLIYSNVSNTPICVGYYTKYPDNKILMSAPNDQMTLCDVAWNLLPSSSNKGYFAIQSESYFGKTDSNGVSSLVGYILEATANNKIGYSLSYDNKAQQEFLIMTDNSFVLQDVEYDLANATVTSGAMISKETTYTNTLEVPNKIIAKVALTANETSCYYETSGKLALNITAPAILKLPRPIPVAGQAVLMEDITYDASYTKTTQNISKTINYTTDIEMMPRSLLKLTTKFKTFVLNVPYVATATYEGRTVKVRGIWKGYAIANPEYYAPINELHFYDL